MSQSIVNGVVCRRCADNPIDGNGDRIERGRLLLVEVWWKDPPEIRVGTKFSKSAVAEARPLPGQPPSRNPLRTPQDKGRSATKLLGPETMSADSWVEMHCHGCGAGFKYRPSQLIAMASRARKSGDHDFPLKPNLGRPRDDTSRALRSGNLKHSG